ncbi:MAG: DNA polymerase I, partial [Verrucomicrobiales bacterium]|nr:DNA polymerase I [Verrucomicrobiales bacterium]
MAKKLFLLDGMALVYRAHFALISRPIFTSKGVNTSALYGFTQTLLEIIKNQQPTHIAVVFDTDAPTQRHKDFAEYKAHRQAMPEELSSALPHVRRMIEAFHIPVITCDGWEADDVIGTLVRRAEREGFTSYMVTPDKDFGQLVSENTFLYRPPRMGDAIEIMGPAEILNKWGIQRTKQVIDLLGLMGDTSDNIPGVPGIGEKTASKLIAQYGNIENLLAHTNEIKGKLKETLEANREQALLSKRLATIDCDAPCEIELSKLELQSLDEEKVKALCVEFEFNSLGRRLFGGAFKAGRSLTPTPGRTEAESSGSVATEEIPLGLDVEPSGTEPPPRTKLTHLSETDHKYDVVTEPAERQKLVETLLSLKSLAFKIVTDVSDHKAAQVLGVAFSWSPHAGQYVPIPTEEAEAKRIFAELQPVFVSDQIEKVGHHLKFDLGVLQWRGVSVKGRIFDTMIAHSLIEPDMRHSLDYLAEVYLGYSPVPKSRLVGEPKATPIGMCQVPLAQIAEYGTEMADVSWQLRSVLEPLVKRKGQERVFYEVEAPLVPVLADMEVEGIKVDGPTLAEIGIQLGQRISDLEQMICRLAGQEFNLNSTRQLGTILFEVLKISDAPKKTKTGLYATDEQTLLALAPDHEIVQRLLEYREITKLKSTYVDALPGAIWPRTGRVHTSYQQTATATGRLNSQDPNLQNIPIRTERGKEIRKAFVPRNDDYVLLSADYSQIELRIIAAL